jgi:hypothetical protein
MTMATVTLAQDAEEGLLDVITKETCECAEAIDVTLTGDDLTLKLGLCVMEAALPYKDRIQKELGLDLMNYEGNDSYELGQKVGMQMLTHCPDFIMRMAESQGVDAGDTTPSENNESYNNSVKKKRKP